MKEFVQVLADVTKDEEGPQETDKLPVAVIPNDRGVCVEARNVDGVTIASVLVEVNDGQLVGLVWDEKDEHNDPTARHVLLANAREAYRTPFDPLGGKRPPLTETGVQNLATWPPRADKPARATRLARETERRLGLDMHGLLSRWADGERADVAAVMVEVRDFAFIVRFTAEVRRRFGAEQVEQLADLLDNAAGQDPGTVVVEVNGGVVDAVYGRHVERAVLIDWDNIRDGDEPGELSVSDMADMPDTTREQFDKVG